MPVSPDLAAGLAQATVDLYSEAERILLARMAKHLAAGLDSASWAEDKLLGVQIIRKQVQALVARLDEQVPQAVAEALVTAYNRGGAAAVADLAAVLGGPLEGFAEPLRVSGEPAVRVLVAETVTKVSATHGRILRVAVDGFRQVIADASAQVLIGTQTRREAAQRALDRFAARGITGFVDRLGRGWDLASYAEMAVRTASARATVDAHADRLIAYGQDLVIVSDAPQECKLCRPWEGKVLSLSGGTAGTVEGGRGVRVAGTLEDARAAGLFHPGCRHSTSLFQPGITKTPTRTADPEGDAARQKLRYLERQTRAWKRREAAALDDAAGARAHAKVAGYQQQIREHVASTSAKRQRQREQITAAH